MNTYTRVFMWSPVLGFATLLMIAFLASQLTGTSRNFDEEHIADIAQLQLALEMYLNACGTFPEVLESSAHTGCPDGTTFSTFMKVIPRNEYTKKPYEYWRIKTDESESYILRTKLKTNHRALQDDVDGAIVIDANTMSTIDCDDSKKRALYYCVMHKQTNI